MRDKTYHIYLDSPERKLLIHSLVGLKICACIEKLNTGVVKIDLLA